MTHFNKNEILYASLKKKFQTIINDKNKLIYLYYMMVAYKNRVLMFQTQFLTNTKMAKITLHSQEFIKTGNV